MPDNSTEIAAIRSILNGGQSSYNVEGQAVTHDFGELRRRLRELIATDTSGETVKRPRSFRIDLSNF